MAVKREPAFMPRKQPVQARSAATVSALHEASIQVLLTVGYRKLTTTRIAERAGVSVGTLYQYFPNRRALITSVIERYLEEIGASVVRDCERLVGGALEEIATGVSNAFIAAKCRRLEVARAMHEPLVDVDGVRLVRAAAARGADYLAALLRSCPDARFREVDTVALFAVSACSSLLQTTIADHANPVDVDGLSTHIRMMLLGYLKEMNQLGAAQARVPS